MGYYIILYNILLLFWGLFINGGLRPLPKWPIASAGPAYNVVTFSLLRTESTYMGASVISILNMLSR